MHKELKEMGLLYELHPEYTPKIQKAELLQLFESNRQVLQQARDMGFGMVGLTTSMHSDSLRELTEVAEILGVEVEKKELNMAGYRYNYEVQYEEYQIWYWGN